MTRFGTGPAWDDPDDVTWTGSGWKNRYPKEHEQAAQRTNWRPNSGFAISKLRGTIDAKAARQIMRAGQICRGFLYVAARLLPTRQQK